MAASRGTLLSRLAKAKRERRTRAIALKLRALREQFDEWPGDDLNILHGALLDALEAVETALQPAVAHGPDPAPLHDPGEPDGERPPMSLGNEWWLHDRHRGLGNAPGTDLPSPTEAVVSETGDFGEQ